jgi:hypothetical protein
MQSQRRVEIWRRYRTDRAWHLTSVQILEFEPAELADLCSWLHQWQHRQPDSGTELRQILSEK